jgi:ABC-type transport system substrate-binding protein
VPAASVFQDFSHHTVIGTGPFVLDPWTEDGPRSAHRNPQYWRPGRPYLDSVTFKTVSETWDRWSALQDGEVDLIKFQGPALEQWAVPEPLVFTDEHQNPARTVFALNTSTGPFDDVTARRLLAVAIDRSEIDGGDSLGYLGRHSPLFSEDPSAVQRYDPVAAHAAPSTRRPATRSSSTCSPLTARCGRRQRQLRVGSP